MSISAEQINHLEGTWWNLVEPILSGLLTDSASDFLNKQISSTFWATMCESRFNEVLEELIEGYDIFIQDEWSVELPKYLIEQEAYEGEVVIDLAGMRMMVRLEHFCFMAKVAAIFYAKYIEPRFKPWAYFIKIDQMYEEFCIANSA